MVVVVLVDGEREVDAVTVTLDNELYPPYVWVKVGLRHDPTSLNIFLQDEISTFECLQLFHRASPSTLRFRIDPIC